MSDLLRVVAFLERLSRGIPRARAGLAFIVLAGVASGLAHAGLVALINTALTRQGLAGTAGLGWAFAALCVGLPLSGFISEALLIRLVQRVLLDVRLRLCRKILGTPLRRLEELGSARLLATLTTDVGAITEAFALVPYLCTHLTMVAGCLVYLGWLSPVVLLGLLGFMALGILSYQLPILAGLRYRGRAREDADALYEHLRGVTEGAKELKMNARRRRAFLAGHLEAAGESLRRNDTAAYTIFAAASGWGRVLFFIAIGLLLFALPRVYAVETAVILGYCITLVQLMTPLDGILSSLPRLGGASVAARKIEQLGLSLGEPGERTGEEEHGEAPATVSTTVSATVGWRRLELVGVTHAYYREGEGSTFLLGPIDLAFEPGELVFLTGGNGSGKTSLAKLLLGLYAPEGGEVRLDGEPVIDRNSYRQLFATVFADFFLFHKLAALDPAALETGDEKAREYLVRLELQHKVGIEGGVLSTADLSQGQRKRLALLTAYLDDRPIYLFDEWAADQDPYFKEIFYRHLLPELKSRGKTVFVISHDDRYYDVADRLIKLANGRVESDSRTRRAALSPVSDRQAAEPPIIYPLEEASV